MSIEEFDVEKISKFPLKTERVIFLEKTFDEFLKSGLECCKVNEIPDNAIGENGFISFCNSARSIAKSRYNGAVKTVVRKNELYLIMNNAKEN